MGDRTSRQCRDRWRCIRQHDKKRWEADEEELIMTLVSKYGPRWKSFEQFFSKRSHYAIKSHYYSISKLPKHSKIPETPEVQGAFSGLAAIALSEHR